MNPVVLARLLRLASPALPIGAYSYSQGLEWAVESGSVCDEASAREWFASLLAGNMARFELPMLAKFYKAWQDKDADAAADLNVEFLAARETSELLAESVQMGRALRTVLVSDAEYERALLEPIESIEAPTFPNSFAFAAQLWSLPLTDALTGYVWSWLENQVMASIKLVPLGQSAGQRILARLTPACAAAVETAVCIKPEDWSNFSPLFAIASSRHESQYTRLFRS
jgi:urease accessory protein